MLRRLASGLFVALATPATALAAGDTAEYVMVFDATWSATTHPVDFPPTAHFSPLIGGTHDGTIAFWEEGQLASEGIERMAEAGSKTVLREEVQARIDEGSAGAVIEGFDSVSSPGMTSVTFTVSKRHPRATIVTMIAPSPDWFVGVHGLDLFQGGAWIDELIVELRPYDAGTDSGVTYRSPDEDTQPPQPISEIMGYPLYNDDEGDVLPLGTFTFRRLGACDADLDDSGDVGFDDLIAVLAAWGDYAPCPPFAREDLDRDCVVGFTDVLAVLAEWGACP